MTRIALFFLSFLLILALPVSGKMPTLEDEHYKTACGPIAGVIALSTLGIETSLPDIAKRCAWIQDEMLPLENLQKALQSYLGVSCQITKITPKQLCDLLKDDQTVIILATRKRSEEIDHAVCAVGVQDNDQVIHLIDYPELHQQKLIGEIADVWDGVALVVRVSSFYRALGDFSLCFAPMIAFIIFVLWFRSRKTTKPVKMPSSATLLLVFTCLFTSCHKQESISSQAPQRKQPASAAKNTIKNSFFLKHHFGEVNANEILTCSLELKNDTDKPMTFEGSSTSCGACLSVKSMPEEILPGETGIFELEFNTAGKRGATPQHAYFWDAEPKTLLVVANIDATVRAVWTDPEMISLGHLSTNEPQKAKLYVMAAGLPDAKVTSVQCETPWLTCTSHPVETSKELTAQNIKAIDYYEIEWIGKEAAPGNLSSKIVFHVQKEDEEQILEVPVLGYLSGAVEIVPAQIVFGRVVKNDIIRTCALSFKAQGIDAEKIKCTADHSFVHVGFEQSKEDQNQYTLTARLTPPVEQEDQLIEGTITGADESGEAIFRIPYIAIFNPSE